MYVKFLEFPGLQRLEKESLLPDSRQTPKDDWHLYEYVSKFLQMDANAALHSRVAANIYSLVITCVLFTQKKKMSWTMNADFTLAVNHLA